MSQFAYARLAISWLGNAKQADVVSEPAFHVSRFVKTLLPPGFAASAPRAICADNAPPTKSAATATTRQRVTDFVYMTLSKSVAMASSSP